MDKEEIINEDIETKETETIVINTTKKAINWRKVGKWTGVVLLNLSLLIGAGILGYKKGYINGDLNGYLDGLVDGGNIGYDEGFSDGYKGGYDDRDNEDYW